MKKSFIIIILLAAAKVFAQADSIKPLNFSGYVETYYLYDFSEPANHTRPTFVYAFNRHNEVNLDLGFVKAAYEKNNVRANLAIGVGTYMNANYAAEPGVLKNIYEANAGAKLSKSKNIWIDAGILPSHIGYESAVGKDCWTLTRSILADNSPYFETGARLSYTTESGKWYFAGLVLNGWQRIQRVDGNNTPAFGHQITYKPSSKITLNSSSFIGNDKTDNLKQRRYFHNLYGIFQLGKNIGLTTGFDIGAEQKSKGSKSYNAWFSPVLIAKISATEKSSFAFRAEYYDDEKGVIIGTGTSNGFRTFGYSVNYDYAFAENFLWRIEARGLSSKDTIFIMNDSATHNNYTLSTAFAISF